MYGACMSLMTPARKPFLSSPDLTDPESLRTPAAPSAEDDGLAEHLNRTMLSKGGAVSPRSGTFLRGPYAGKTPDQVREKLATEYRASGGTGLRSGGLTTGSGGSSGDFFDQVHARKAAETARTATSEYSPAGRMAALQQSAPALRAAGINIGGGHIVAPDAVHTDLSSQPSRFQNPDGSTSVLSTPPGMAGKPPLYGQMSGSITPGQLTDGAGGVAQSPAGPAVPPIDPRMARPMPNATPRFAAAPGQMQRTPGGDTELSAAPVVARMPMSTGVPPTTAGLMGSGVRPTMGLGDTSLSTDQRVRRDVRGLPGSMDDDAQDADDEVFKGSKSLLSWQSQ